MCKSIVGDLMPVTEEERMERKTRTIEQMTLDFMNRLETDISEIEDPNDILEYTRNITALMRGIEELVKLLAAADSIKKRFEEELEQAKESGDPKETAKRAITSMLDVFGDFLHNIDVMRDEYEPKIQTQDKTERCSD